MFHMNFHERTLLCFDHLFRQFRAHTSRLVIPADSQADKALSCRVTLSRKIVRLILPKRSQNAVVRPVRGPKLSVRNLEIYMHHYLISFIFSDPALLCFKDDFARKIRNIVCKYRTCTNRTCRSCADLLRDKECPLHAKPAGRRDSNASRSFDHAHDA
jgi:hypothetical protein